ncbi:hypothetical protein Hanom_Chr03g00219821 [Helianthus anomalus]
MFVVVGVPIYDVGVPIFDVGVGVVVDGERWWWLWLSERRCRWCPSIPVVPVDAGCVRRCRVARRCRWCPSMPVLPVDAGGAGD